MIIGAYAFPTFGRKRSEVGVGLRHILNGSYGLDMLVAPEFTNLTLQEMTQLSIMDKGTLLIPGSSMVREGSNAYNRAYVLRGGDVLHIYDKKSFRTSGGLYDFDYLQDKAGRPVMERGRRSGVFSIGGITYGLEICADHDQKTLKNEGAKELDYQIVLGTGIVIRDPSVVVKREGAVIAVDGGVTDPHNPVRPSASVEVEGNIIAPERIIKIGAAPTRDDRLYIFSV
jgi:hypothetical protein